MHYVIYKKTGILHRDLSVNNVMFIRRNGRVFGVLNDWDLAAPEVRSSPPTSFHRTGTAAYMALNLLRSPDGSVPHRYYHDLESFAWILVWCALVLCFNGKEVIFDKRPATIKTWTGETDWKLILSAKRTFLIEDVDENLEHVTTAMKSLQTCCIAPVLRNMKNTFLFRSYHEAKGLIKDDFFQFEAFMKVLEPEVEGPEMALWSDESSTSA